MPKTNEVLISFKSEKAAKDFMTWLDECGEQDYQQTLDSIGDKESLDNAVSFEYDHERNIIIGS